MTRASPLTRPAWRARRAGPPASLAGRRAEGPAPRGKAAPPFREAYPRYVQEMNVRPAVILVKVGEVCDTLERACKELGLAPHVVTFRGDYYSLPNLVPLLAQPSRADLLLEIIEYPLP